MESNVTEKHHGVRVLAVVPVELQPQIRRQLGPLGVDNRLRQPGNRTVSPSPHSNLVSRRSSACSIPRYLLVVPLGRDYSAPPLPESLDYAHTADFRLWSGVRVRRHCRTVY
jgi:hypothetical protein